MGSTSNQVEATRTFGESEIAEIICTICTFVSRKFKKIIFLKRFPPCLSFSKK